MSWYVGQDGQQVWIPRDEVVFTVVLPVGQLPVEELTYLATHTKKAVYQEHIINEDLVDGKSRIPKRQRAKQTGSQRGFIVRADIDEAPLLRVVPWFKAASQRLLDDDVVMRVDAEEASNLKKKKKDDKEKRLLNLGANECRVETTARINHFAHGPGFRVEVSEGAVAQRIHFFTARKDMKFQDWHGALVSAIEAVGSHVMLARREAAGEVEAAAAEGSPGGELRVALKKDKAQEDDDAWLASMMNACVAPLGDEHDEEDGNSQGNGAAHRPPWREAPLSKEERAERAAARRAAAAEEASRAEEAASEEIDAAPAEAPAAEGRQAARPKGAARPAVKPPAGTSRSEQLRNELQTPDWRRPDKAPPQGPALRRAAPAPPQPRPQPAAPSRAQAGGPAPARPSVWENSWGVAGGVTAASKLAAWQPGVRGPEKDGHQKGVELLQHLHGGALGSAQPASAPMQPKPQAPQARPPVQQQAEHDRRQAEEERTSCYPAADQPTRWQRRHQRHSEDPGAADDANGWWQQGYDQWGCEWQGGKGWQTTAGGEWADEDWGDQHDWARWRQEAPTHAARAHGGGVAAGRAAASQLPRRQRQPAPAAAHTEAAEGRQHGSGRQREVGEGGGDGKPGKAAQKASSCGECGRGGALKLHFDDADSNWFCRKCWEGYYGVPPPGRS